MTARSWGVTFDAERPVELADFWALALGYVPADVPPGFQTWEQWFAHFDVPVEEREDGAALRDPAGVAPPVGFLKVPEGKVAKNRVHLDVRVSGGRHVALAVRRPVVLELVDRLVAAGGTVLRVDEQHGELDHVVMADPEGNEFCVI